MGRLVITHSSYINGLLEWGKLLAKAKGIKTVTPGIIGRTRGKVNKLTFRLSRKTQWGFKVIARNGSSYQEVYIVTELKTTEFQKLLKI